MSEHSMNLVVKPFRYGTDKDRAVKLLEEAAEAYNAWQEVDKLYCSGLCDACVGKCREELHLAEELADCITICCNIAAFNGIDIQKALDAVKEKNESRGRY